MLYNGFEYKSSSQESFRTNASFINDLATNVNISQLQYVTLTINITYNYLIYDVYRVYYCFDITRKLDRVLKTVCGQKNYGRSYVRNDILASNELKTLWTNTTYEYQARIEVEIYNGKYYECPYYSNLGSFILWWSSQLFCFSFCHYRDNILIF